MEAQSRKPMKTPVYALISIFVVAVMWLFVNPYISVSNGFKMPRLIQMNDNNILQQVTVTVSEEDVNHALSLQDRFCTIDYDDLDGKIELIKSLFEETGLTFDTYSGDEEINKKKSATMISRAPTLLYGVYHSPLSNTPASSIIFSTELNMNATANPKATAADIECPYFVPSAISLLLSLVKSFQQSEPINHDIVIAIHINKYSTSRNHFVNHNDVEYLLKHVPTPLFNIHVEVEGNIIPISKTFRGYSLKTTGLNGRNANLNFVAVILNSLPILDFHNSSNFYLSYIRNFMNAAISRSRGFQQEYLYHSIPAVTLVAHSMPANLKQRTHTSQINTIQSILHGLKKVVITAGISDEPNNRGDTLYIPLFASTPRYVHRYDILIPIVMIIASFFGLMKSTGMLKMTKKVGIIYLLLTAGVSIFYGWMYSLVGVSSLRGETPDGLNVFVFYLAIYSVWLYDRLIFPRMLTEWGVCEETQYKQEVLSTAGWLTVLGSMGYLPRNPWVVGLVVGVCVPFIVLYAVSNAQKGRYLALWAYSGMIAVPFLLMGIYVWCTDLAATVKVDGAFLMYLIVVVVGNHAILHYVNGMSLMDLDEEGEEKEKKEKVE